MFNVLFKSKIAVSAAISFAIMLSACNSKSESTVAAENLLGQAEQLIQTNPAGAIVLLDSIQHAFPSELQVGREALALRPKAIEASTLREITSTDSLLAVYAAMNENTRSLMKKIADKNLVEPYYVPASGYNASFMSSSAAIQPRVDEIGQFFFLSIVNGKNIRHNSFTIVAPTGSVSVAPVPFDGESNYRINSSELVSYMPEACDTIGKFVADNAGQKLKVVFNGEKGKSTSVALSAAEAKGIVDAWNYSRSITESRELAVKREKLDQQLQIARNQIARLSTSDK